MMKKFKKLIALGISLVCVMGSSINAFAGDVDDFLHGITMIAYTEMWMFVN